MRKEKMLIDRWAKRIMRAAKTEVVSSSPEDIGFTYSIIDRECEMKNCVKDHEKIMNYLQQDNTAGHAHNLDMLLASLNLNQHLRESFLSAEVIEDEISYKLQFPFGIKTIEYILSKKAVDSE